METAEQIVWPILVAASSVLAYCFGWMDGRRVERRNK